MQTEQTQNATPQTLDMEALVTRYLDEIGEQIEKMDQQLRVIENSSYIHKTPGYYRLQERITALDAQAEKVDTLFGEYEKAQRLHAATAKNLEQVEFLLRELIGQPAE